MAKKLTNLKKGLAIALSVVMMCAFLPPLSVMAYSPEAVQPVNAGIERPVRAQSQLPVDIRDNNASRSRITAGAQNTETGVTFNSFGGNFAAGDYLAFPNQHFTEFTNRFMLKLAAPNESAGDVIEIRIGSPTGTQIGSLEIRPTRGPEIFWPQFAETATATGVQDVFLVFPQATYVDMDYFVFTEYYFPLFVPGSEPDDGSYAYLYAFNEMERESGVHDERMQWFRDASFGMFIHFGVYSWVGGRQFPQPPSDFYHRTAAGVPAWRPGADNLSHLDARFIDRDSPDRLTPVVGQHHGGNPEWHMRMQWVPRDMYKEFVARPFNPTEWDAEAIVELAHITGQRYIVITSRHHDGFSMFNTEVREHRDWSMESVANFGEWPSERDILRELADAIEAHNEKRPDSPIVFGTYITMPDWADSTQYPYYGLRPVAGGTNGGPHGGLGLLPNNGGGQTGLMNETFVGATSEERDINRDDFLARLKGQLRELIVDYGSQLIWFDEANMQKLTNEQSYDLYHFMRALNPNVLTNNRFLTFRQTGSLMSRTGHIDYSTPEHQLLQQRPDFDFEVCYTLNNSWGFRYNDHSWKSPARVVEMLTQTVGLNGNLLFNIGPDGLGNVPQRNVEVFHEVGRWMDDVSESIHDTRGGFYTRAELPTGVFSTIRDGRMFFHLLPSFTGAAIMVPSPGNEVLGASVLNTGQQINVINAGGRLFIDLSRVDRVGHLSTVIEVGVVGFPVEASEDDDRPTPVLTNIAYEEFQAGRMRVPGVIPFPGDSVANMNDNWRASPAFVGGAAGMFPTPSHAGPHNMFNGVTSGADAGFRFYATRAGVTNAFVELEFDNPVTVNQAVLYVRRTQNAHQTRGVVISTWNQQSGTWEEVGRNGDASTAIRENNTRIEVAFEQNVTTTRLRLDLPGSSEPGIFEFQLFNNPYLFPSGTIIIEYPSYGDAIPAENFTMHGTFTGTADEIEARFLGDRVPGDSVIGTVNNQDGTWSIDVDTTDWPRFVEQLTVVVILRDGGREIGMNYRMTTFGILTDYAVGRIPIVSSQWNTTTFSGERLTDGDIATRWGTAAGDIQPWFIIPLDGPTTIDRLIMREWNATNAPHGFRNNRFIIEVSTDAIGDNWELVYQGMELGLRGVAVFDYPIDNVQRVRVTFLQFAGTNPTQGQPSIHSVEIYNLDGAPEFSMLRSAISAARNYPGRAPEDLASNGYGAGAIGLAEYDAAFEAAEEVLGNAEATQAEINAALNRFRASIQNMLPEGVYTAEHVVLFHLNGGNRTGATPPLVQNVVTGAAATTPTVTRAGWHFAGWNKVVDNVTENMVVSAQWTDTPFVAVTGIDKTSPLTVEAGYELVLAATITPQNATDQNIIWSITDAGATNADITNGVLTATAAGEVVVTATVVNGMAVGTPFIGTFTITVEGEVVIPVLIPIYVEGVADAASPFGTVESYIGAENVVINAPTIAGYRLVSAPTVTIDVVSEQSYATFIFEEDRELTLTELIEKMEALLPLVQAIIDSGEEFHPIWATRSASWTNTANVMITRYRGPSSFPFTMESVVLAADRLEMLNEVLIPSAITELNALYERVRELEQAIEAGEIHPNAQGYVNIAIRRYNTILDATWAVSAEVVEAAVASIERNIETIESLDISELNALIAEAREIAANGTAWQVGFVEGWVDFVEVRLAASWTDRARIADMEQRMIDVIESIS